MWTFDQIEAYLRENLTDSRYRHTLGVVDITEKLSEKYGADKSKARYAALIHDCAKNMSVEMQMTILKDRGIQLDEISIESPQILHGLVGAIIAKENMGIDDEEILDAVKYHTTGRRDMSKLEKIIYIGDYIEPNRTYPGVDRLREITFSDLDKGVLMGFDNTISYVIKQGQLVHHFTFQARNYLILEMKKKRV